VLVISKSFHADNERLAHEMKRRGVRVAVDFCDDHFEDARFGAHFHTLAEQADIVIAVSEAMADAVRRHAGRHAIVVSDPVEGPRGAPRFAPRLPRIDLAWFGHPSNLPALAARAEQLAALARRYPVRLRVVTLAIPEARALLASLASSIGAVLETRLVPWSRESTWQALAECDAAWIPVEDGPAQRAKSPNRLVEAAWAGRLVVADPVPAYQPWADVLAVGQPLEPAIIAALDDPASTCARIAEAQRRVAARHSPAACALEWARALGGAAPAAPQ
jgi:hypothetical protein